LNLKSTTELHLSGLTGTANHPDMQKIRIIGVFFENRLHWQFEMGNKISTNGYFRLHVYLPSKSDEAILRVFERKIMRAIFGPTNDNGE
jgi:hypothetical protein